MSFAGLKALFSWARTHWVWALIVFLVVIPILLFGFVAKARTFVTGLPVIGPMVAKLPTLGA